MNNKRKTKMIYYVYELIDSTTNVVFYVGKGSKDRMYVHEKKILRGDKTHNNHLDNKIRKIHKTGGNIICNQIFQSLDEEAVLKHEILIIEEYGLENLCNMTGGGDGRSPDEETRKKISENRKGIPVSDSTRKKMSDAKKGRRQSSDTKRKKSNALKGNPQTEKQKAANQQRSNSMKGRKLSDEHKQKLRDSKLNKPTKFWEGKQLPEDMKQKISNSIKKTLNEKKNE